jgi:putative methyltransferase (TIGR04325 family)
MNLKYIKKLISKFIKRNQISYATYEEALLACKNNNYLSEELVRVVIEKNVLYRKRLKFNPIFQQSVLSILAGICPALSGKRLNVIDFGGGGGNHYSVVNTILSPKYPIKWHVIETKPMCEKAQKLTNKNLRFFNEIDDAANEIGDIDLVITSSALQYCNDPLFYLQQLINLNAPYLFISRTPFIASNFPKKIIAIQSSYLASNGPGPLPSKYKNKTVLYPITYVSKNLVEKIIGQKYMIRFQLEETNENFQFNNISISMTGYFCALRNI